MASSSSSSSSSCSSSSEVKWRFDVFINFRGEDVRYGFVDDLHKCLLHRGIHAYIDSEDLRRGDKISPALMKAIEESRIAVLVFSENYASSSWCLDELVKVMECKRPKEEPMLPVFYKVEPGEIRGLRGRYGDALARHEKLGQDPERVDKWREALIEAANLAGWHYTDEKSQDETELIEKIVKVISNIVERVPLSVAKYPVGVGCRVEKVMSLLNMGLDDVRMIGIWGPGGVGKTTIAKDVYNSVARQFDGYFFLANVRENSSRPNGLVYLQKTLLSKILWKENVPVSSVDEGANLIRDRLHCRKILLVLDDVDHEDWLNALAGECAWFGKGSRIIVTTRDKHVLTSHRIDWVYEVKPLDQDEAFELLSSYAFPGNQTKDISRHHIDNILGYANGLPLAIVVLGPFLCGRSRGEWESTLENLAENPKKDINSVLKISFDALEDNEKDIFLDIACFFKGRSRDYVTKVLDGCGLKTLIGIQALIERSLLTIEQGIYVQMHDLLQLMGQDIVKQECPNEPGKRSRLWCYDDVFEVLSEDTGTNAIKGILLNLPTRKELHISPSAFTHMRLKLLILSNARISGGPVCLPNDLRWLEWHKCHSSTLKFSAGPKKLVCFDVDYSRIKKFRGNLKDFEKLKFINLSRCQLLVRMPELNYTPNLEELNIAKCKNLELVHESIAYHSKLRILRLSGCPKLQSFPDIPIKNEALREISLHKTGIKELPASIENLVALENMFLDNNRKLAILPSSIYKLQNLELLFLEGCSKLIMFPKEEEDLSEPQTKTRFPMLRMLSLKGCSLSEVEFLENLSSFPCLRNLDLSRNNFTNLPTWEKLYNLEILVVSWCQQLQEIPKIPGKLRRLDATFCKSLNRIPSNICDVKDAMLHSNLALIRHWFPVNDLFKLENYHRQTNCRIILPGGEMPEWLLPNKEGYISFVASKHLYKKILGVAFCIVYQFKTTWAIPHDNLQFEIIGVVNGKRTDHRRSVTSLYFDHVWFEYIESKDLWIAEHFGPNESSHFHISIRLSTLGSRQSKSIVVKKCGFRLICKPLENDLEVWLQDNQLLDPTLLYEVSHEDNPTSTKEESSSETGDLSETCTEKEGFNMAHFSIEKNRYSSVWSQYRKIHPGREMPKEFVLVKDGTISFMASQDLYDNFLALYLCVVFGVEDGKKEVSFDIVPHVNGQRRNVLSGALGSFDMDHVWFQLFLPNALWGVLEGAVDFGQFDESYLNFSLNIRVAGATVKKLGYVIQSYHLEDALKVELEEHRLMDPASLLEDDENPLYYGSHRGYPSKENPRYYKRYPFEDEWRKLLGYIEMD